MAEPAAALRPRLRRADFLRVTRQGRRVVTEDFLVFFHEREDGGGARLGITVTRRVGNAVRRNRIKRLVREWFRQRRQDVGPCDVVVIAKREIPSLLSAARVSADLDRSLGS